MHRETLQLSYTLPFLAVILSLPISLPISRQCGFRPKMVLNVIARGFSAGL